MSLYAYGLGRRGETRLPEDLRGLADELVRVEVVAGIEAIVTEFRDKAAVPNRENILAHERVLDAALEHSTPLPFRFGTVISLEKLSQFIQSNEKSLNDDLQKVSGCVQMTARLLAKSSDEESRVEAGTIQNPGTQFLKERQARRRVMTEAAEWFTEAMRNVAETATTSILSDHRQAMATIAHLVPRSKVEAYRNRFDEICQGRPDLGCLRSGPWPPYAFVFTGKSSLGNPRS
jgi:hypothetical protein